MNKKVMQLFTRLNIAIIIITAFICAAIIGGAFLAVSIKNAPDAAINSYNFLLAGDFKRSGLEAKKLRRPLKSAGLGLRAGGFVLGWTELGEKISADGQALRELEYALDAYINITDNLEELLKESGNSYHSIENKAAIALAVSDTGAQIEQLHSGLASVLNNAGAGFFAGRTEFSRANELLEKYRIEAALAGLAPNFLSPGKESVYLLILQNSHELRPTGGFIGNYGILRVQDGHINEFYIKDIYSLDRQVEGILNIAPPEPLRRYFNRQNWYMRDSNWSPDFPTAAREMLKFYEAEGGVEGINGIIAITPEIGNNLLDYFGPVEVDGKKYSRNNFIDTLQYHVEIGYRYEGLAKEERKDVVDKLAQDLKNQLINMPLGGWQSLAPLIKEGINKRDIQFYFNETEPQNILAKHKLTGGLISAPADYIMAVDANLGSAKTDPKVARHLDYVVNKDNGKLISALVIAYEHLAKAKDWRTSHYRTYTRVYLPAGAKIINVAGAMKDDTQAPGQVDIYNEDNKTVVGAFISVNINETKKLVIRYELPAENFEKYSLLLQKQPGNEYTDYRIMANGRNFSGTLDADRFFE